MNDELAVAPETYATGEAEGVRYREVVLSNDDTSGRPLEDWETWTVKIAEWSSCAGHRDSDGVVWPTAEAIKAARQLIDRMKVDRLPRPTEVVPSGDGGIVLSRRTGNAREEIELSETGDAELFLFQESRLIHRTPW